MIEFIQIGFITAIAKIFKFLFEIGVNYVVDKEVYGVFAVLISYLAIYTKIATLGVQNITIREYPKYRSISYRSFILFNSAILILSMSILIYLAINLLKINYLVEYHQTSFIAITSSLIILYSTYFRSIGRTELWIFFQDIIGYIIFFTLLFILHLKGNSFNVDKLMWVYLFSLAIAFLTLLYILQSSSVIKLLSKISLEKIKYLFDQSLPVLFSGLTYIILSRIDVIMLSNYISLEYVGEYNIVARIALQVLFFNQVIISYYYPKLAKSFANNEPYKEISRRNNYFVFLSFSSVALASTILLILVFHFSFFEYLGIKNNTQEFEKIVIIFLATQVIYSCLSFYGNILIYIKRQKVEYVNNIIVLSIGIILNYLLIPVHGGLGAALATSVALLVGSLLQTLQVRFYANTFFIGG